MKTKNIFRMLLMAVMMLVGVSNAKADIELNVQRALNDATYNYFIDKSEFAQLEEGMTLRIEISNFDTDDFKFYICGWSTDSNPSDIKWQLPQFEGYEGTNIDKQPYDKTIPDYLDVDNSRMDFTCSANTVTVFQAYGVFIDNANKYDIDRILLVTENNSSPVTYDSHVTYAMSAGETHKSNETVEVKNGSTKVAELTFGVEGGADFKAAKANSSVDGFTAFTEGNGVNGTENSGTVYIIKPVYDGEIEVAVVLNSGKNFYIKEDGVSLADYDGITESSKYSGTYTFNVKAGSTYKVYCTGSKLGFYGFNYNYNASSTPAATPHAVTISTNISNGTVTADKSTATAGETVTLTITPNSGYHLGNISVFDENNTSITLSGNGNTRTFTMPGTAVTVYAGFSQDEQPQQTEYVEAKIGTTGYATFSSTKALNFSGITTLTAYYASEADDDEVTLTPVTGTVAANTGLVIVGTTTNIPVVSSGTSYSDNLLVAVSSATNINSASDYVLTFANGRIEFASTANKQATVPASHAYLHVASANGRQLVVRMPGNTTAIGAVDADANRPAVYYNLNGQRVDRPTRGLYIVNGKKVLVK